jgi:hypothetical protein
LAELVFALGEVDFAHAAFADAFTQAVMSDQAPLVRRIAAVRHDLRILQVRRTTEAASYGFRAWLDLLGVKRRR